MNTGKCPKCGKALAEVQIEPLDIKRGTRTAYHGVSFSCPSCHTVLSTGIDPVVLKVEILKQLLEDLKQPAAICPAKEAEPAQSSPDHDQQRSPPPQE